MLRQGWDKFKKTEVEVGRPKIISGGSKDLAGMGNDPDLAIELCY